MVSLEPSNPFGYFYLGQSKLYQQQWDAAIRYFSNALKRQYPERERLLVELALAQNEAGHPDRRWPAFDGVTPASDDRPLGAISCRDRVCARQVESADEAIEAIRQAMRFDGSNSQYREFLIGLLLKSDERSLALAEAIRAQQKFPDNARHSVPVRAGELSRDGESLSKFGVSQSAGGRSEESACTARRRIAVSQAGQDGRGDSRISSGSQERSAGCSLLLGIVYKENGEYEAAEREYREAERISPESGQVLLETGQAFAESGRVGGGESDWKRPSSICRMPRAYIISSVFCIAGWARRTRRRSTSKGRSNPIWPTIDLCS